MNQHKKFGDPLRYWMITRILTYLLNDNNQIKLISLSKPLTLYHKQCYFIDIMNSLITTMNDKSNSDQRIQIGLLLIITLCYECREAIYKMFAQNNNNYMQYFVKLATNSSTGNDYNRGLSTYIIALCLEFARDLSPNQRNRNSNNNNNASFSPYLFQIVNNQISLDRFKSNLEKLRNTNEYKKMIDVIQKCKQKVPNNNNNMDEMERKKRLMIEEIFIHDFDIENEEYIADKNNRMRINLFTTTFEQQFEKIFSVIDKRIIQLISCNNQNLSPQKPGAMSEKPPYTLHNDPNNMNRIQSSLSYGGNKSTPQNPQEIDLLKSQNESLKTENQRLNEMMDKLKKSTNNDDIINAKLTELEEIRKQFQEQNHLIIEYKEKIAKQQQIIQNNRNRPPPPTGPPKKVKTQQPQINPEIAKKYNNLRKKYEELNRDHEDLLVFVGHIHGQLEKSQKELNKLRFEKHQLLTLTNNSNGNNDNNNNRNINESVESKSMDMETSNNSSQQPRTKQRETERAIVKNTQSQFTS